MNLPQFPEKLRWNPINKRVEVNADQWKTWVHQRLITQLTQPGSISIHDATFQEHLTLAKHLTAEAKTEGFVAGKGVVTRWDRLRKQNHWLDAIYNACAAGYYTGVRLIAQAPRAPQPKPRKQPRHQVLRSDSSPWIDRSRWRGPRRR